MIGRTVSHYRILSELGSGGMGIVYEALDTNLDRTVALKFLAPELTRDPGAKARFIHEAKASAALSHANICTIYEVDESKGQSFIAMECYEGETLKQRIAQGPLPLDQALDIGKQVAQGLVKAHEKDIVHRDIKPANIFITTDGQVKILDFGLAKLAGQTRLTKTGKTVGTAAYFSPEQARGDSTDHRSDIWSLGVTLYEMVTGLHPFKSEYEALAYSIMNKEPEPVTALRAKVPMELEHILGKALAKAREERYQHADEFLADLRRCRTELTASDKVTPPAARPRRASSRRAVITLSVVTTVLVVALVLVALNSSRIREWFGSRVDRPSLAVLFFDNLGPPGEDDFIAAGLTEDIITGLSQISQLDVLSRSAVERYRGKEVDPQEVGRTLRVDYVIEGSVRRTQDKLRVTAQLIDAESGFHVWADNYDGVFEDIFTIQDTIATRIGAALQLSPLSLEHPLVARRWTDNAEAYAYFLVGREKYWDAKSPQRTVDARPWFEKALDLDPDYAPAMAGLAYAFAYDHNVSARAEPGCIQKALDLAQEARRIDPSLAMAWRVAGDAYWGKGELQQAESAHKRAIEENLKFGEAYKSLAEFYYWEFGQMEKATEVFRGGISADPYWYQNYEELSLIYRVQDFFAEAEHVIIEGLAKLPEEPSLLRESALIRCDQRRYEEAIHIYKHVLSIHPDDYKAYKQYSELLRRMGQIAEADSVYQLTIERWSDVPRVLSDVGWHAHQCQRYEECERLQWNAIELDTNAFVARWRLAHCLFYQKRQDEAEEVMLEFATRWPDLVYTYVALCNYYLNLAHDSSESMKWAKEMQRRYPGRALSYSWLGQAHLQSNSIEQAVQSFKQAIKQRPTNYSDYVGLYNCKSHMGLLEDALAVTKKWNALRPRHALGWNLMGIAYYNLGNDYQAAAAWEKAHELDPFVVSGNNLSLIYGRAGRYEKQIEVLYRAVEIDSTATTPWLNISDAAWYGLRDSTHALRASRKVIQLVKSSMGYDFQSKRDLVSAYLVLGDIEVECGDLDKADEYFQLAQEHNEELREKNPERTVGISQAGLIYARQKDYKQSRECAQWLWENQRRNPGYCVIAARIFSAIGDTEKAFEALEAAIAADYHNKVYLLNVPDLDNIRGNPRFQEILDSIH